MEKNEKKYDFKEGFMLDQLRFLENVKDIKTEFNIKVAKRSNDKMRRRTVRLVTDEYLLSGGNIHQNFFFEEELYNALKSIPLICDATPEEIRIKELPLKKRRNFNPLKLVSEGHEPENKIKSPLIKEVLSILTKEEDDGVRRDNKRGSSLETFKYKQRDTFKPTDKKEISFYTP